MKQGFYFLVLSFNFFLFTPYLFCNDPVYNPSYIDLGKKISIFQDRSYPAQITSSNRFFEIEVETCYDIFSTPSSKNPSVIKVKDGTKMPYNVFIDRSLFRVKKKPSWQVMMFDTFVVDSYVYDLVPGNNPSISLEQITYVPGSTKYAISPRAFHDGLHQKPTSELTTNERLILKGTFNYMGEVKDPSDIGYYPTLSLSGFFYEFSDKTADNSSSDTLFESLCKKYNIPYVRGTRVEKEVVYVKEKAKYHAVSENNMYNVPDSWEDVGSGWSCVEKDEYFFDKTDLDLDLVTPEDQKDLRRTWIYKEIISPYYGYYPSYTRYLVPVDAPNIKNLLDELNIEISVNKGAIK